MRKLERVSFCIELKFLNGKCTFVQRERNASGRRYTLVFSMIYDSASVFTERRIQNIVTMNNFTGPFFSFFLFRAVSVSQLYTMFVLCQICAILPQMLSQFLSICVRHYRTKCCFKHPQN